MTTRSVSDPQIIQMESCPGHRHYRQKAKETGYVEGGLTVATEDGHFLHVPMSFVIEVTDHPEIFKQMAAKAAEAMSRELKRLE